MHIQLPNFQKNIIVFSTNQGPRYITWVYSPLSSCAYVTSLLTTIMPSWLTSLYDEYGSNPLSTFWKYYAFIDFLIRNCDYQVNEE